MKRIAKVILTASLLLPTFFGVGQASAASVTDEMIDYSKTLIGIPYVYGGNNTSGFDCSGFIKFVYDKFNISLPRISADQYAGGTAVNKEDLIPGDLVFFNTAGGGKVSHSGIYLGDNQFIHADSTKGIKISNLETERYWKNAYHGAKRYIEAPATEAAGMFQGLDIRENQVGVIEVKKSINLWKRDSDNKLIFERVLNPGEKYRVYGYDSNHGGQYALGGGLYITDMKSHIDYHSLPQVAKN
ncbi:C40 family peptidase [Bacillus sp. FJAT-49705]|uniref:C40 family peptidase n=1 Tax=Cytobacillus citreus TaxID=2833586 RepID=A0ABS5NRL0_9BACI|nr:C40 family peptidase [Cytobacillus citreus]MBS4190221.1 C40 family peptidase [Cytobacillus citreus]